MWLADAFAHPITVYRPNAPHETLSADATLTVADVIPGFRAAVRDLLQT